VRDASGHPPDRLARHRAAGARPVLDDTVTVFIPTGTPAGTYYLLGCATTSAR
jgi:hypothetical protein